MAETTEVSIDWRRSNTRASRWKVKVEAASQPPVPYETATECKRLINFGHEPKEIAARLGITRRYVDDLLLLVGSSHHIRKMVKDGQLSATEAIKQLRTDPSNAVAKLIEAIDAAARVGKTRVTGKILKTRPADAADKPMGPAAPSGAAPLSVCIDNALANRLRAAGWTVIPPCRGDVRDVPRMPGMRSAPN